MNFRQVMLSLHVLVAVFGVGQIGALTMLAFARTLPALHAAQRLGAAQRLVRSFGVSLGLMLLTGLGLLWSTDWLYAHVPWFTAAFSLYLVLGGVHGWLTVTFRRALRAQGEASGLALRRATLQIWIADALVAAIVVLMVAKPF